MKRNILLLAVVALASFGSCKSKKQASSAPPAAFEPSDKQVEFARTRWAGTEPAEIKEGHRIFTTRCNQCHEAFEITRFNEKKWRHEIDEMAPKANLTAEEKLKLTKHILSYLDSKTNTSGS